MYIYLSLSLQFFLSLMFQNAVILLLSCGALQILRIIDKPPLSLLAKQFQFWRDTAQRPTMKSHNHVALSHKHGDSLSLFIHTALERENKIMMKSFWLLKKNNITVANFTPRDLTFILKEQQKRRLSPVTCKCAPPPLLCRCLLSALPLPSCHLMTSRAPLTPSCPPPSRIPSVSVCSPLNPPRPHPLTPDTLL